MRESFHHRSIPRAAGPEVRGFAPNSGSAHSRGGSPGPIPRGSRPEIRSVDPEIRSRHPKIRSRSRLGCSRTSIPCSGRVDPPATSARGAGDRSAGAGDRSARAGESRRASRGSLSSERGIAVFGAGDGHFDSRGSLVSRRGPVFRTKIERSRAVASEPKGSSRFARLKATARFNSPDVYEGVFRKLRQTEGSRQRSEPWIRRACAGRGRPVWRTRCRCPSRTSRRRTRSTP